MRQVGGQRARPDVEATGRLLEVQLAGGRFGDPGKHRDRALGGAAARIDEPAGAASAVAAIPFVGPSLAPAAAAATFAAT